MSEFLRSLHALKTRFTTTSAARSEAVRIAQEGLDNHLEVWGKIATPEQIRRKTTDTILFHTQRLGGKPDWYKAYKTADKEMHERGIGTKKK